MTRSQFETAFRALEKEFDGELHLDSLTRKLFATDASAYQEQPIAVAFPKTEPDIQRLIQLARRFGVGIIPRTAGTSLAGQVVGSGIVVDVSRHFTSILEINPQQRWVRVQPGVIRDELNRALKTHGLQFGPETSTANRAMVGGMLGNNSCGSNSVIYGSTREHTLEVSGFLSDGSRATFGPIEKEALEKACQGDSRQANIYRQTIELLRPAAVREEIHSQFPKPEIQRRNTGYAIDLLIDCEVFSPDSKRPFDFCKLLAGSEGTLFFCNRNQTQLPAAATPGFRTAMCSFQVGRSSLASHARGAEV